MSKMEWPERVLKGNLVLEELVPGFEEAKVIPNDIIELYADICILMLSGLPGGFDETISDEDEAFYFQYFRDYFEFRCQTVLPKIKEDRCKKKKIN